jgi:hypothetical protein
MEHRVVDARVLGFAHELFGFIKFSLGDGALRLAQHKLDFLARHRFHHRGLTGRSGSGVAIRR